VNERPTIAKIAEQAGVSVPTVSKVLNGRSDVAAATRARIESLIQEYGYRRRSASTGAGPMIDLVFSQLGGEWAMELIRGVEEVARAEGVELVLSECGGALRPRQEWIESVLNRRPLGVIMVFSDLDADQRAQLETRRIPFVVVDPVGDVGDDVPSIGSANWNGGRLATTHLRTLGHRRIGMIGGPRDTLCSRQRVDGYTDALRSTTIDGSPQRSAGVDGSPQRSTTVEGKSGAPGSAAAGDAAGRPSRVRVDIDPELIRWGDFSVSGGYREALALLRLPDPPTAIFAGSDMQALGVYQAARELGLDIPRDLSVVGYDDLPVAQWVTPALTTVHQPLHQMAELAARVVLDLSRGKTPTALRLDLAVDMKIRRSTARAPA
jgi:DNA-binding LacI/PurR family transcriptional regulator